MVGKLSAGILLCLLSCGPKAQNSISKLHASSPDTGASDAIDFASFFHFILQKESSTVSSSRYNYVPPANIIASAARPALPLNSLEEITSLYKEVDIDDLVDQSNSIQNRLATHAPDYRIEGPIPTLVFINGLASEFVETPPFAELFDIHDSRLENAWLKITEAVNPIDKVFDFSIIDEKNVPLTDLVDVRSVEVNNKTLFNFIYLKPIYQSLESIGLISDSAVKYQRRLNKVLSLLHIKDHVYLMGHSRGAAIALEMMSNAAIQPNENPWLQATRGIISLSGVLFGTELVDELLFNEDTVVFQQFQSIRAFLDKAEILEGDLSQKALTFKNNFVLIKDILQVFGKLGVSAYDPEILRPLLQTTSHQLKELFTVILGPFLKTAESPVAFYNQSLLKLKSLLGGIYWGIKEISSQARTLWWEQHTLPQGDYLYYALPASMNPHDLGEDLYHTDTIDYTALKSAYLQFSKKFALDINDSQLPMHRTIFWPHVIRNLNPQSPLIKTKTLSILANHHWGLTMQTVQETRSHSKSPFPRLAFLKALAYKIRLDMKP